MTGYSLSHLADHLLSRELSTLVTQEWAATARLLACMAEFDERKLYLPAGYPSMFAYCVRELRMSEDAACRRIAVARTARRFPALFPVLADGRLNLTAVQFLSPHLTDANVQELIAAATHKSKAEIELLLAERFPRPDVPTLVRELGAPGMSGPGTRSLLDAPAESPALARVVPSIQPEIAAPVGPLPVLAAPRPKLAPLSPGRFALQLTVDQETHEQLRYAQALLGHAVPSGDVAQVLKRALNVLVEQLEKRTLAKASRTRPRRGGANGRYVPAEIRRAVWQRDGGQCTFVSDRGHRCEARSRLELDHIEPVARGGRTSTANTRLRCRAHNQYAAECAFGAGFMREKRDAAKRRTAGARSRATSPAPARVPPSPAHTDAPAVTGDRDVIPWLRQLGFGAEQARHGASLVAHIPDASLEERVKLALRGLMPASVRRIAPMPGGAS